MDQDHIVNYSTEFLKSLTLSRLLLHNLQLQVGSVVIMLGKSLVAYLFAKLNVLYINPEKNQCSNFQFDVSSIDRVIIQNMLISSTNILRTVLHIKTNLKPIVSKKLESLIYQPRNIRESPEHVYKVYIFFYFDVFPIVLKSN